MALDFRINESNIGEECPGFWNIRLSVIYCRWTNILRR